MDDLSVDIDSLALDGQTSLDEQVAAAIGAHAAEPLDADLLSQVSHAVVESIRDGHGSQAGW